jgi:SAM-dependent MidA family methyltransferase
VIDEASEASRALAKGRLASFCERVEFCRLADLEPIDSGVIFSNELLDAFSVHRVTVSDGRLCELYVDLGGAGEFTWTNGRPSSSRLAEYLDFVEVQLSEGQIAEINLGIEEWLTNTAAKLRGGYIVTVDYGAEASDLFCAPERRQGTLRAFHRNQFADPILISPGARDLTTTIDWTFVRKVGEKLGLATLEFERQDKFLLQSGLLEELELLAAETQDEGEKLRLRTTAREMILPTAMATSFQVLLQKRLH